MLYLIWISKTQRQTEEKCEDSTVMDDSGSHALYWRCFKSVQPSTEFGCSVLFSADELYEDADLFYKFSLNGAWHLLKLTKAPTPEAIQSKGAPCTGSECCTVELVN